jgi:hypothetical protein
MDQRRSISASGLHRLVLRAFEIVYTIRLKLMKLDSYGLSYFYAQRTGIGIALVGFHYARTLANDRPLLLIFCCVQRRHVNTVVWVASRIS